MKLCLSLFCSIILILILSVHLYAQSFNVVKGTVKDSIGNPLEGVTITEKGTSNAVVSKTSGIFSINIKNSSSFVLVFKGVSLEKKEMKFTSKPDGILNITLKSQKSNLDEVVVIAYGKTTRRLASNSVVSIDAKQIEDLPVISPQEAMVGLVAGASIVTPSGEPGQNPYVRIRGLGSIGAGNDPLYVVDGSPTTVDYFSAISPVDIQSIQILKDAASCALYGSRGGNGIIMVTTKRGGIGKTKFSANVYHGISNVSRKISLLNANQYMDYSQDAFTNAGGSLPVYFTDTSHWANTNWQDQIFKTGNQDNYQLAASAGSELSKYYVSGSYLNQGGVVPGTSLKRYSVRANYDAKVSDKIKIGMSIAPNYSSTSIKPVSGNSNGAVITNGGPTTPGAIITNSLLMPPIFPVRIPNGDYAQKGNSLLIPISNLFNPVATMDLYQDNSNAFNGLFTSFLTYDFNKNLSFKTSVGAGTTFSRRNIYLPGTLTNANSTTANLSNPVLTGISASQSNSDKYNWVWENTLNYKFTKGLHRFDVLTGYSAENNIAEGGSVSGRASSFTNTDIQYVSAAGTILGSATYTANSLASVFGRLNYSYKSRYIFTASIRNDGSSRFGPNNRYASFPSISAAWRMADENFMRKWKYSTYISELKLRSSYGVTGNNNIGNYSWQSYEQPFNAIFGTNAGSVNYGYTPNSITNPNLTWETNKQLDMGLELGLLENRIYLTVETFQRKTTNLILNQNIPSLIGFSTTYLNNVGQVNNNGVDIQLSTQNINSKNFRWTTNFNISWVKNKVIALSTPSDQIFYTPVFGYTNAIRVVPGLPMGSFYGYKQIGVYGTAADVAKSPVWNDGGSVPGDIKYADINGDGVIDANDITYLGNPYPKYTYGMQNNFTYKSWSFGIAIQGSVGGLVLNAADRYRYTIPGVVNVPTMELNRWKSETNQGDGWTPRVSTISPSSLTAFSSHELYDASYLRIKTVSVRYGFPRNLMGRSGIQSVSIYVMAQNLFTFQKYYGFNPEANLNLNSQTPTYGVDQGSYPLNRTINFGATISF